jgi:hypothetical protein
MATSSEWNTALCRNAKYARPFCYKMGQIPPPLLHLHPHLHPSIPAWIFSETQEPFSLLWIRRHGATHAWVAATRQLKDISIVIRTRMGACSASTQVKALQPYRYVTLLRDSKAWSHDVSMAAASGQCGGFPSLRRPCVHI